MPYCRHKGAINMHIVPYGRMAVKSLFVLFNTVYDKYFYMEYFLGI